MTPDAGTVYIIDDDPAVRDAVGMLAESAGLAMQRYSDAAEFLAACSDECRGCAVVDLRLPGLDGLDLQAELRRRGIELPLIFLTGYGDVSAAVQALKAGAVDFLEKPFDDAELLEAIQRAIAVDAEHRQRRSQDADAAERLALLTPREREVMERIAAGKANKVIALELGISERTVELHRSRVMHKLGVGSVAELVRLTAPGPEG